MHSSREGILVPAVGRMAVSGRLDTAWRNCGVRKQGISRLSVSMGSRVGLHEKNHVYTQKLMKTFCKDSNQLSDLEKRGSALHRLPSAGEKLGKREKKLPPSLACHAAELRALRAASSKVTDFSPNCLPSSMRKDLAMSHLRTVPVAGQKINLGPPLVITRQDFVVHLLLSSIS